MRRIHYLLPLITVLLFTTCKKDEEEGPCVSCPENGTIEDMKEWFYFLPGTYWIYQEETSGDLDTVHVYDGWETESSFRVETQSSVLEEWIPGLWVKYNYYYNYTGSRTCLSVPQCTCHKLERVKSRISDFVAASTILHFPFIEGNYANVYGGTTSDVILINDTVEVDGQEFEPVSAVNIGIDVTEMDKEVEYYYARNVGLIRKTWPSEGKTWNLIEYNIIQ